MEKESQFHFKSRARPFSYLLLVMKFAGFVVIGDKKKETSAKSN